MNDEAARQGSEGFLGTGDDQAGAMALDVAMEQFASSLAPRVGWASAGWSQKDYSLNRMRLKRPTLIHARADGSS